MTKVKKDRNQAAYSERSNIYLTFIDDYRVKTTLKFKSQNNLYNHICTHGIKREDIILISNSTPKTDHLYSGKSIRSTINEHSEKINGACSRTFLTERS